MQNLTLIGGRVRAYKTQRSIGSKILERFFFGFYETKEINAYEVRLSSIISSSA